MYLKITREQKKEQKGQLERRQQLEEKETVSKNTSLGENWRNVSPRGEVLLLLGYYSYLDAKSLLWVMSVSESRWSKDWI